MLTKKNYTGELTCVIACSHLAQSIKWYTDIMGFSLMYQVDDLAWAEFKTPLAGITVGLEEDQNPRIQDSILTFSTPDIELVEKTLLGLGADCSQIRVIDGLVKLLKVSDPDGNTLQFAQSIGE